MKNVKCKISAVLCLCFCLTAARGDEVKFKTSDGCLIAASYGAPSKGKPVFVNVHGLGSNKGEWASFEKFLKARGSGWLSLDLRGHGQSLECLGKKADYRAFGAKDWRSAAKDIVAAVAYLQRKKLPASKTALCGASVGANLVLKAAVDYSLKPAAVIMLSPGLVYAGIGIEEYFHRPLPFSLLLAASPDDDYAWQSSMHLFEAAGGTGGRGIGTAGRGKGVGKVTAISYSTFASTSTFPLTPLPAVGGFKVAFQQGVSGHGVNMFSGAGEPLMEEIALWAVGKQAANRE